MVVYKVGRGSFYRIQAFEHVEDAVAFFHRGTIIPEMFMCVVKFEVLELRGRAAKEQKGQKKKCQCHSISEKAIHEAAHAVVAAQLRVPFTHVRVKPGKDSKMATGVNGAVMFVHELTPLNCTHTRAIRKPASLQKKRQLTKHAIIILASRAAVDEHFSSVPEKSYVGDEEDLRFCANELAARGASLDSRRK